MRTYRSVALSTAISSTPPSAAVSAWVAADSAEDAVAVPNRARLMDAALAASGAASRAASVTAEAVAAMSVLLRNVRSPWRDVGRPESREGVGPLEHGDCGTS